MRVRVRVRMRVRVRARDKFAPSRIPNDRTAVSVCQLG